MKKILLPVLAAALLAGCAKESDNAGNTDNGLVPIRLGAGVSVSTKASIETGNTFTAGIGGWESNSTPDYTQFGTGTWYSTANIIANPTTPQSVPLSPGRNYSSVDDVITYMKAWHPAGKPNATGLISFENTKGDVDVLLATAIQGSREDYENKVLAFTHQTAQLIFQVKSGEGLAANTTLKSLQVVDAELPNGIQLGATDAVQYAAPANKDIPDYTADSQVIGAELTTVGAPMMIKPGAELKILASTNNMDYDEITVSLNGGVGTQTLEAGKSYTISLTFGTESIELKATVEDWEEATGSAELQ